MASPEAAAPALDPSASRATAASARETNTSIRRSSRCGRCPRWRVRPDPDAASSRSRRPKGGRRLATLLYDSDGGAPFERAAETRDGITVWMRASPDPACAVKEVLAEARFGDVPVAALWRAVGDVHRYDEFVPFVKRSDVIRTCDRTGDAWVYNVVKPPVASPRDYVIRVSSDAPAGSPGSPAATNASSSVLRSSWTIDDAHGPNPKRGTIRLRQNRGSWELTDDGRGGCAVKYRVFTDPGAALPGWLVDVANKTSVPDVLRAFAKRAVDGTYEREDAEAAAAKAAAKAESAFDAFAGFGRRTATFRDETMDRLGERFGGFAAALPEAVGALAANALAAGKGGKGGA